MSPQNRAAWLMEKQAAVMTVGDAPYNKPDANEIVVKTMAVAINPADVKIQELGILIDTYPAILGCDVAGIVEEVGSEITTVKPGDHVVGQATPLGDSRYRKASFQHYVVLQMPLVAKIPKDTKFSDASVLPLGITTAASCLFQDSTLALDMPPNQGGRGKTLLVWGASSSVGSCGVQLAAAAGYEVFGVASKHNHAFVESIGASRCFDQADPNLVNGLVSTLKGKIIVGAYDAISTKDTLHTICEVLHQSDGKKLVAAVMPGAEACSIHDVKITTNFSSSISDNAVGPQIWQTFLEPALEAKTFQYKPTAEVVGHGLVDIQKACDLLNRGVSAKKLVVTL